MHKWFKYETLTTTPLEINSWAYSYLLAIVKSPTIIHGMETKVYLKGSCKGLVLRVIALLEGDMSLQKVGPYWTSLRPSLILSASYLVRRAVCNMPCAPARMFHLY